MGVSVTYPAQGHVSKRDSKSLFFCYVSVTTLVGADSLFFNRGCSAVREHSKKKKNLLGVSSPGSEKRIISLLVGVVFGEVID